MLLNIDNADVYYADKQILKELSLTIEDSDRIGLIGQNGAGKSTLINLICGKLIPEKGSVAVTNGVNIGLLEQSSGFDSDKSILEEMRSVFADLLKTEQHLKELSDKIASGDEASLGEYEKLSSWFQSCGGYDIDVKINTILNGMGFGDHDKSQRVTTLSGGEKTRLALAKLLLANPKLLILDEPTNHLDFETLMWLENYLSSFKNGLLIVSHDRYFLDHTVTKIWDIESRRVVAYNGNYTRYKELREERIKRLTKEYEAQQNTLASMQDYVDRNIVRASTSNMAKSRLHQMEHITRLEKPPALPSAPSFSFEYNRKSVLDVLSVKDLALTVGTGSDRVTLAENISFTVRRGEKIAIIGRNGIGKTTLLQALMQEEHPNIHFGANVQKSYYEQEFRLFSEENTVLEELWGRYPLKKEYDIRSILGQVQITGENVFKKMGVLSGGEKARTAFALLMMERGNLLILDEPTNHLDLYGKEALEKSLREFDGTLLFVSHDRYFLDVIPSKIIEMTPNGIQVYEGNFDFYLQNRKEEAPAKKAEKPADAKNASYRSKADRAEAAKRKSRIRELERLIEESECAIERLNAEIASPEVSCDFEALSEACAKLEQQKADEESYMLELCALSEE